jgi:hypothetical protein
MPWAVQAAQELERGAQSTAATGFRRLPQDSVAQEVGWLMLPRLHLEEMEDNQEVDFNLD